MPNEFIYGLSGGIVGTFVSHPFDTIKTRIQSKKAINIKSAIRMGSLYSGIMTPLTGIGFEKLLVFGFYNKAKEYGYSDFVSGLIGGFISTIIVTPIDRIKINFQNNNNFKIEKRMFHPKYLYKGFTPTIFRETPGFGIYFTTYNYLNKNNDSLVKNFIFGSISGFVSWIFIYPSDYIKTKIQSNENSQVIDTIKNIYKENNKGLTNFYRGFPLAIMRAVPLHGGVFLGYELSKKYI